ncbi:MAG: class I SAM-dependent methyltransferase [Alphaproteobacteria bacterium]|nr:class I SAM-dependent methyltransferase [Alphaproteobacteria bacterium]
MKENKPRVSFTACIVIVCLVALHNSKRWAHLVTREDAEFYKTCLTQAGKYSLVVRLLSPFPALVALLVESFFAKGMVKHYALRKLDIRRLIEDARADGAEQCVILGGGFDICAYRMASKHKDFNVFEIDRPLMHWVQLPIRASGSFPWRINPGSMLCRQRHIKKSLKSNITNYLHF